MAVGISETSTGALPFQSILNQTQTTADTGSNTGFNQNRYSAGQLAAQGSGLTGLGAMLSGQASAPASMGLPQSAYDAYMLNFNRSVAPQLAAQHGSGSPAIPSMMQQGLLELAAKGGQLAVSNTLQGYDALMNYAFKPQGIDEGQTASRNVATTTNATETGYDWGGILGGLAGLFPQGGSQPVNPFGTGTGTVAGAVIPGTTGST